MTADLSNKPILTKKLSHLAWEVQLTRNVWVKITALRCNGWKQRLFFMKSSSGKWLKRQSWSWGHLKSTKVVSNSKLACLTVVEFDLNKVSLMQSSKLESQMISLYSWISSLLSPEPAMNTFSKHTNASSTILKSSADFKTPRIRGNGNQSLKLKTSLCVCLDYIWTMWNVYSLSVNITSFTVPCNSSDSGISSK